MARFVYSTDTPIGQLAAEGVNCLLEGSYKLGRAAESVTLMDESQMTAELGVPKESQAGFRSALNQLKKALEAEPFSKLLPNLDQG